MIAKQTTLGAVAWALALGLAAGVSTDAMAGPPDPRPGATAPVREQNTDADGWIRVHEQGVADVNVTNDILDVNLTNDAIEVNGTVSVDNFPSEVDVNVVGGSVETSVAPATAAFSHLFIMGADTQEAMSFGPIDATTIHVSTTADDEAFVSIGSPLGATLFFVDLDGDKIAPAVTHSFFQPVPLDHVEVRCLNESADCGVQVTVIGD